MGAGRTIPLAEAWGVAGVPAPSFGASRADALLELIGEGDGDTEIIVHVSAETSAPVSGVRDCSFQTVQRTREPEI